MTFDVIFDSSSAKYMKLLHSYQHSSQGALVSRYSQICCMLAELFARHEIGDRAWLTSHADAPLQTAQRSFKRAIPIAVGVHPLSS
jgi:hypothetical protein